MTQASIRSHPNLVHIGQMAVFYIPSNKLDNPRYGTNNTTPRTLLHDFIINNYDAYTHQKSDIRGFWRSGKEGQIIKDDNEMFEVSFHGKDRVPKFIDFLATLCHILEEDCLYLCMGSESWLVLPKPIE